MVARGTVAGGFGNPLQLTAHGDGLVYVAQLSSGATYVAWDQLPDALWKIAVIRKDHLSRPVALPHIGFLQRLVSDHGTKVAAVWGSYRSTHYAFLGPNGQLRHRGSVAVQLPLGSNGPLPVAVNERGDFAAVGTHGHSQTPMLVLCPGMARCDQPIRLPSRGEYQTNTVALSDSGSATALGANNQHGRLWGVVAHVGHARHHVRMISRAGEFPVAAAQGRSGAVALFSTRATAAWLFVKPRSDTFTTPRPIRDPNVETFPTLAANLNGDFLAAWGHNTNYRGQPSAEVRASIGAGTTPGQTVTIAPASSGTDTSNLQTGIDDNGDAIITWSQFYSDGPQGLFVATHIHR